MARTPSAMVPLGTTAPDFSLPAANPDIAGADVLSRDGVAQGRPFVVVFWCNHCPFVHSVEDRFADQAAAWRDLGVGVVAISSNDAAAYPQDSFEAMAERAQALGYSFPYLYDETQVVARAYGAACTPDFYLFDGDRRLVYRGQLDDGRPGRPATTSDLDDAVRQLVETGHVTVEQRPSLGCNIKWRAE